MPTEVQHRKKKITVLFHIAISTGCLPGLQSVAHGLFFYTEKFVTFNIMFACKEKYKVLSIEIDSCNCQYILLNHLCL